MSSAPWPIPSLTITETVPTTTPSSVTPTTWWSNGSSAPDTPQRSVRLQVDLGVQQPPVDLRVGAPGDHRVEVCVGGRAQLEPLGAAWPEVGSGHGTCLPAGAGAPPPGYGTLARHEHRRVAAPRPDLVHRGPAQGRAARAPRGVGLAPDRRRARGPAPRQPGAAGPARPSRASSPSPTSPTSSTSTSPRSGCCARREDVRMLTYEVARDLAAQQVRYAELTMTPYTSVVRGIPIEAYTEAIEDARVAAERDHGVVLRWIYDIPGESGLESADATLSYALRPPARGAGRVRPRRPRDRRAARAVRAALRRRQGRRAALGAALGRVDRAAVGVGRPHPARRRADRPRHVVGAGPPRCSSTWPSTASRSRSARRPTSRPGSSSGSRSTRSGPCAMPASS